MRAHLKQYQEEIMGIVKLNAGDTIVDIGSNDSTMLQYYPDTIRRIGVDPTGSQFRQFYNTVELLDTYFTEENFCNKFGPDIKCKMVSSISMFYDLPNPVQFAKDIYSVLHDDGIWTCEQSYLIEMLKTNSIDTICHEHLEYYSMRQIVEIAARSNFKIIDVKFNTCNGGSFRIYFAKQSSKLYRENTELVASILNAENEFGLYNNDIFVKFMKDCDLQVKRLQTFIDTANASGKTVSIYGASTKGNCLLQYANIGENRVEYAVERNLNKVGKMTCTGVEIISEDTMRASPPDYLLVLPWHFRDEILVREREFMDNGGQFIFPFPYFDVVSTKPKVLITGCDGMIAHYMKQELSEYSLYGVGRTKPVSGLLTSYCFDLNNTFQLEDMLCALKPDIIIHLASISSSHYALNHPIEALNSNGMVVANICDIIHRNSLSSKLFNATSSEMYKGHTEYLVEEDDTNMFHLHPYSIAKIMGHSIVEFYRKTYQLPFSNGIIFSTESKMKKPTFLLSKVANHIREWKSGNHTPLVVGNLDSYRNILHASDVAKAIHTIVSCDTGDSYLICGEEIYNILDLVLSLYSKAEIQLDDGLCEVETGVPVLITTDGSLNSDQISTNIHGACVKLRNLGWSPAMSMDDILSELL
jgi:GDP-D-mannose dehydratase